MRLSSRGDLSPDWAGSLGQGAAHGDEVGDPRARNEIDIPPDPVARGEDGDFGLGVGLVHGAIILRVKLRGRLHRN